MTSLLEERVELPGVGLLQLQLVLGDDLPVLGA